MKVIGPNMLDYTSLSQV